MFKEVTKRTNEREEVSRITIDSTKGERITIIQGNRMLLLSIHSSTLNSTSYLYPLREIAVTPEWKFVLMGSEFCEQTITVIRLNWQFVNGKFEYLKYGLFPFHQWMPI